jgi:peptide chain release factor 1
VSDTRIAKTAMIEKQHVERALARLPEIERLLADPAAAANRLRFRDLVREHANLRKIQEKAEAHRRLEQQAAEHRGLLASEQADPDLKALARSEIADVEQALARAEKELQLALAPPDPADVRGAILEIRAGTGGDEAALFAADLFRMYSRYADQRKWKVGLIDASASGVGGYKEIVFSVEGPDAYGHLRFESGVHRVQRVPVTEAAGRIHTSTATVAVFPEAEPEDDIEINPAELRIDVFCASGPGGQHVNKTSSAVRITHLPTGVVAQSQDERSQHRNREKAMAVLLARILDARRREEDERKGNARRTQIGSGDRSERIRTYNFPQNRLTDHRINLTLYSLNRLIEGEIGEVVHALREHAARIRMEEASSA